MARADLGVMFNGLRGKVGNVVVIPAHHGVVVRERVTPHNPRTPGQTAARDRQSQASRAWAHLTPAQVAAWRTYAAGEDVRPMNAFVSLANRVLLVNASAQIPELPPTSAFFGDALAVTAAASSGGIELTASAPNGADVVTQILVQKLASPHRRTYLERYRHAAVVGFTAGHLSSFLPLSKGVYGVAYRFIRPSTGQATNLAEVGVVAIN